MVKRGEITDQAWQRGIATRYEKRTLNYRAMGVIASLMMRLPS